MNSTHQLIFKHYWSEMKSLLPFISIDAINIGYTVTSLVPLLVLKPFCRSVTLSVEK